MRLVMEPRDYLEITGDELLPSKGLAVPLFEKTNSGFEPVVLGAITAQKTYYFQSNHYDRIQIAATRFASLSAESMRNGLMNPDPFIKELFQATERESEKLLGVDRSVTSVCKLITAASAAHVMGDPRLGELYRQVMAQQPRIISQSVAVSMVALALAYQGKVVKKSQFESLALASLLHQVGKIRLPESTINGNIFNYNETQKKAAENVPSITVELIKESDLPGSVSRLIMNLGVSPEEIRLSQYLDIAGRFVDLCFSGPNRKFIFSPGEALWVIRKTSSQGEEVLNLLKQIIKVGDSKG